MHMYIDRYRYICTHPPKDGEGLTIFGNLKSFEGPVLNCRSSTTHRAMYLNELVIFQLL